jgi:DNA-binding transcriptional regulator GbsR (MarR family)
VNAPDGFVDRMAGEFAAEGFPRIPARVLMALTGTPDARLTAAALAEQAEVSPAAISGAVRYLELLGMVRRMTVPGTRRHLYVLADDDHPWYTGSLSRTAVYERILRAIRTELADLPEGPVRERMTDMESFYAYIQERLPALFGEWRASQTPRETSPVAESGPETRSK